MVTKYTSLTGSFGADSAKAYEPQQAVESTRLDSIVQRLSSIENSLNYIVDRKISHTASIFGVGQSRGEDKGKPIPAGKIAAVESLVASIEEHIGAITDLQEVAERNL